MTAKLSLGAADFPVCLYSTGTVAIGGTLTPDADDLQNDFQRLIQIEEIRFLLFVNGFWNGGAAGMCSLAASIRIQLKAGRLDLTNGFVPLWLLGTRMQSAVEMGNGLISGANASVWEYQRWKLPVPVIIPDGATLLPQFQYITPTGKTVVAHAADSPITVHVALIGRSLSSNKMPAKVRVPYVSAWVGRSFAATGGLVQQSGDDQLVNKFSVPLHVQRFTGRIAVTADGTDGDLWQDSTGSGLGPTGSVASLIGGADQGVLLSLKDHAGYFVAPASTAATGPFWDNVFDPARKAFTVNSRLEPRGWYTASVQGGAQLVSVPMIGMVGWREEELSP